MKKFISGIIVGVLIFAGATVFADTAKNLFGKKVEGTFEVVFNGEKINDAAVIEGSTYLPVRSISEAAGINIAVEGKTISLTTQTEGSVVDDLEVDKANKARSMITSKISIQLNTIETHNRNIIIEESEGLPPLVKRLAELKAADDGSDVAKQGITIVEGKIADSNAYIADLKAKIATAEAEIEQLKTQLE